MVTSYFFGSSGELSAYIIASNVPFMLYDLLVGGMLSAALVPVFSTYAGRERRGELARIVSAILTLIGVVLAIVVILLEIFAVPVANILGDFEDPALQTVLANCLRLISPALILFGIWGGVTGLLYALKRFNYTALSAAVFNLGIVIAAPLLSDRIGIYALPIGFLVGAIVQLAVTIPGFAGRAAQVLRRLESPGGAADSAALPAHRARLDYHSDADHRRSALGIGGRRGERELDALRNHLDPDAVGTRAGGGLTGLAALAFAACFGGRLGRLRGIFGRGLRLVLVLLIPATVALWVLAVPVIQVLFQHGAFTATDTVWTAQALHLYLFGLMFAGVDFLLNYTFYARQDTRTPTIVGVIAVGVYFVVAWTLKGPLGFLGLVLADSAKQFAHAAIMIILLLGTPARLHHQGILKTLAKASGAAIFMGAAAALFVRWLPAVLPGRFIGELMLLLAIGVACGVLYLLALSVLRVPEVRILSVPARRIAARIKARG